MISLPYVFKAGCSSVLLLFLLACNSAPTRMTGVQPFAPTQSPSEGELLEASGITRGQTGYLLYDPVTQRTLTQLNAQKPYLPGSVNKIITLVSALKILGPDYRFQTLLTHTGKITHGVLEGDLYLVGKGDPFLNLSDLMAMIQTLKSHGIKKINGRFFYDEFAFLPQKRIDLKRDSQGAHNPGVSALSSEFNRAALRWKTPKGSSQAQAFSMPSVPSLQLDLLTRDETQVDWVGETDGDKAKWHLSPVAGREGVRDIPIHIPALYTASSFKNLAGHEGLILTEPTAKASPAQAVTLVRHRSLPLIELSEKILEYSNNLMAELVLIAAAQKVSPHTQDRDDVSISSSAQIIASWLKKQLPETSWNGFQFETGSGLGGDNHVTPDQLMAVLGLSEQLDLGGRGFSSLLPISGWKGTLSHRMNEPDTALRVWAKTGSLYFTQSLAGTLYAASGKKLRFVILNTDFKQRTQVEGFDGILPPDLAQSTRAFKKKAELFQERLLTRWIQEY